MKSCSTTRATTKGISSVRLAGLPAGQLPHVLLGDLDAITVAQHRFEHDADRDRQARNLSDSRCLKRGEVVELASSGRH